MILYFSATGNSKYIAVKIAEELNDNAYNIEEYIKIGKYDFDLQDEKYFGIVNPTYFFGLPKIVEDYFNTVVFNNTDGVYCFNIATYGTSTGAANKYMGEILKRKGLILKGRFGIKTVDTWTPMFDLTNKEKIKKKENKIAKQIIAVSERIKRQKNCCYNGFGLPKWIADLYHNGNYVDGGKTDKFKVANDCISCGLCERQCPSRAIEMKDGKPVWIKEKCNLCLRCLHRCPEFAISYGEKSKMHGQYFNDMK